MKKKANPHLLLFKTHSLYEASKPFAIYTCNVLTEVLTDFNFSSLRIIPKFKYLIIYGRLLKDNIKLSGEKKRILVR